MKKICLLLIFMYPVVLCSQDNGYWSSPLDHIWMNVAPPGFSPDVAYSLSLAFSPSGEPYLAYQDWANTKKNTVMKFNGTGWVIQGTAGFSPDEADFTSLAFGPSGNPYVGYGDYVNGQPLITRQVTEPKTMEDISNLPSGVYLVKVVGEKGVQVGKFVKQ
jgi:hypothetical protein